MEEQATTLATLADKTLDRRRFTLATAMAMLAGVAITITEACGSSYSSPTSATGSTGGSGSTGYTGGDKTGTISNNHGHSAVITAAQLNAGGDLTLNIQGTATHNHTVALSAAQLVSIAGGTKVAQQSSTDFGHSHTVTFNA